MAMINFKRKVHAGIMHKVRSGLQGYIRFHDPTCRVRLYAGDRRMTIDGNLTQEQIATVLGRVKSLEDSHYSLRM